MRLFNRYYSIFDLTLLAGDIIVAFVSTAAVRAATFVVGVSSGPHWGLWALQGVAMASIVVVAFYYCDLYAIDQALSLRDFLLRFVTGIGFAIIATGVISYPIPEFGKTIYASEMVLLIGGLAIWRIGFMRLMKKGPIQARVLVIGLSAIGKLVVKELCQQTKLGMKVVGFIGDVAGQVVLPYGNPTRITLPVFLSDSLEEVSEKWSVNRILL